MPLGYSGSTRIFDETRFQMLIPASHLPATGSVFTGIEVWSASVDTTTLYASLDVTISTTFAANLPAPILVYSRQSVSVAWVRSQWMALTWQVPVPYDGMSNLVIDIRKIASPTNGASALGHGSDTRPDLPICRYTFGGPGSGASRSDMARSLSANLLAVRLSVGAPTLLLRSRPSTPSNNAFPIGGAFDVEVRARPNTVCAILGSVGFGSPTRFPPISGDAYLNLASTATLLFTSVPANGVSSIRLAIPNDVRLAGANLVFQAPTERSLLGLAWTNASSCVINP